MLASYSAKVQNFTMERGINFELFRQWAYENPGAEALIALNVGISTSMANKLIRGVYNSGKAPKEVIRKAMCEYMEFPEDLLFPYLSEDKGAAKAS